MEERERKSSQGRLNREAEDRRSCVSQGLSGK
jgi:hypothetical protein